MPPAKFQSATIPQNRLLPGIHGLRGLAALAVVLFHIVHLANIAAPPEFAFIASYFGYGVHLFFVLSAFSLMHSTEHTLHRTTWASEYFIKRFFRIAPLFYCILAGMVLWPAIRSHTITVNPQYLLLNLTFTFGLTPWSGIVWGGWTIGVEMLFYAILPVLLLTVRSRRATLLLVVISIIITHTSRSVLQMHYEHTASRYGFNWSYFSFTSNLCFFALGMYAFRVAHETDKKNVSLHVGIATFTIALLAVLFFGGRFSDWKGDLILWGIAFSGLSIWQSQWPTRWCANAFFEYVGERSYSVYLLHPVVIMLLKQPIQSLYGTLTPTIGSSAYFLCAGTVLLPLLLLSELTYRLLEVPGIRLGQRICVRFRQEKLSFPSP